MFKTPPVKSDPSFQIIKSFMEAHFVMPYKLDLHLSISLHLPTILHITQSQVNVRMREGWTLGILKNPQYSGS